MKFSKMLTSLLVMCLLCSMCVSVFAAVVSTDGSTGSVPVTLTTEVPTFSVTVPTALPITVKADGTHVYATNVEIVNNSKGMVHVVDMDIEGANSWVTVDYDSADMASEPVDSQVVALNVNGDKTTGENTNTFTASNYNTNSRKSQ